MVTMKKRKSSLIEDLNIRKRNNCNTNQNCNNDSITLKDKMYKKSTWYKSLVNAEKTCLKDDKIKKIHYKFKDNKEMIEEYNIDTQVLLRRAWKETGKLESDGKWLAEIGDPIPDGFLKLTDIIESKDQPVITSRNTRVNLEWRIRNLPYPINIYTIKTDDEKKCIIVSTSNKKYYKKIDIPVFTRLGLTVEQENINATHQFNTLIITYKKPQQLLEMEKEWYEELKNVKPGNDIPDDCKAFLSNIFKDTFE